MKEIQLEALAKNIISTITMVPGLVGLTSKNSSDHMPKKLKLNQLSKGIEIIEVKKGVIIKIFALISLDIRTKVVVSEISTAIKRLLKIHGTKLVGLNIFVKGVA